MSEDDYETEAARFETMDLNRDTDLDLDLDLKKYLQQVQLPCDTVQQVQHSDTVQQVQHSDAVQLVLSSDTVHQVYQSDTVQQVQQSDTVQPVLSSNTVQQDTTSDTVQQDTSNDTVQQVQSSDTEHGESTNVPKDNVEPDENQNQETEKEDCYTEISLNDDHNNENDRFEISATTLPFGERIT